MAIKLRTKRPDKALRDIVEALKQYQSAHPRAKIEVYRHNSVSVRIRVVNPEFSGQSWGKREDDLWAILDQLPEDIVAEISVLLLLTPEEAEASFANFEFDHPISSQL